MITLIDRHLPIYLSVTLLVYCLHQNDLMTSILNKYMLNTM